ncbi:MAG TPA: zinc-ribbon domain-containing protein [Bdellovibrionota bacterium]|nr:zinc-ribbon domain-containing protein [Bdellovibrionota bacterium]
MMVVECDQCHSRFRMDPNKIGPGGARVRCAKCEHIFVVKLEGSPKEKESDAKSESEPVPRAPSGSGNAASPAPSPPKIPPGRTFAPIARHYHPWNQRLIQVAIVASVALSGILLGLTAMGSRPTPHNLKLLFQYGRYRWQPGPNLLRNVGTVEPKDDSRQIFRVEGELFNYSDNQIPEPSLLLEVFSVNGEFLGRTAAPCCSKDIAPYTKTLFTLEADLPNASIGNYNVTIQGERGPVK